MKLLVIGALEKSSKMKDKINLISLFSGAGGFDLGFEKTGKFHTLAALESNATYLKTLLNNRGFKIGKDISFLSDTDIINDTIENISGSTINQIIKKSSNALASTPDFYPFKIIQEKGGNKKRRFTKYDIKSNKDIQRCYR